MPYAKVMGEDHRSKADQREQSNLKLSNYDTVFEENHDEEGIQYWGITTIGALPYLATFRLYMKLTKRIYHGHRELLEESRQLDVAVEKDIDLGPISTYRKIGSIWKILIPIIAIFSGLVIGIFGYATTPSLGIQQIQLHRFVIAGAALLFVFLGLNHGLTEIFGSFAREWHMAEIIDEMSKKQNYENVLVICGDQHAPIIVYLLEEKGWDCELNQSYSWLAKTLGVMRELRLQIVKAL